MNTLPPPPKDYVASHKVCGAWLHRHNVSCQHFTDLALESMDRGLSANEKIRYYFHFLICSVCRKFTSQIKSMYQLIRAHFSQFPTTEPTPEFLISLRHELSHTASTNTSEQRQTPEN